MPTKCAVVGCRQYDLSFGGSQVSFYTIPTDSLIRQEWLVRCGRQDKKDHPRLKVCSLHFAPEDLRPVVGSLRKKLKSSNVFPSLFLDGPAPEPVYDPSESEKTMLDSVFDEPPSCDELEVVVEDSSAAPSNSTVFPSLCLDGPAPESIYDPSESEETMLDLVSNITLCSNITPSPESIDDPSESEEAMLDLVFDEPPSSDELEVVVEDSSAAPSNSTVFPSLCLDGPAPESIYDPSESEETMLDLVSNITLCSNITPSPESIDDPSESEEAMLDLVFDEPPSSDELEVVVEDSSAAPSNSTVCERITLFEIEIFELRRKLAISERSLEIERGVSSDKVSVLEGKLVDLQKKLTESYEEQLKLRLTYKENMKTTTAYYTAIVKELQQQIQSLEAKSQAVTSTIVPTLDKDHNFECKLKDIFRGTFTSNQIDVILKKKVRPKQWSADELSTAFTIRYLSQRAYVFFRETLNYPLPGLSTLRRWAGTIDLRSGIFNDVLRIMQSVGTSKTHRQKVAVISFDEMKIASLYEYDKKRDEIVGPHSNMQNVVVRGLFDSWKQPVFVDFDVQMTKCLLFELLTKLHEIEYHVVAMVNDCGGGNQGLWKELGVNTENISFPHPVTKEPVFCFGDAPHLLKLIRNWFIDYGFCSATSGQIVSKAPVAKVISLNSTEVSSIYKLTPVMITVKKAQRQNVELAAQLLSHTTATALEHYKLPDMDPKMTENTQRFVRLCSDYFDIFNSYVPNPSVPSKLPYGLDLERQNKVLNDMISFMQTNRVIGKTSLQVFQKAVIMSCKALPALFTYLKDQYDVSYLLTHRLNQDVVENLHSQLRTRGGLHDHPSPLNVIYRLRVILLGKNPGLVQQKTNTQVNEGVEFLSQSALHNCGLALPDEDLQCDEPENVDFIDPDDPDSLCSQSTTASHPTSSQTMVLTEKDGLEYVAGAIAFRHKDEFPHLGVHTYKLKNETDHHYAQPTWIQHLSYGGLLEPSPEWRAQNLKMERYFRKLHRDKFGIQQRIKDETTKFITSKVASLEIHSSLIESFVMTRINIRVKYLNFRSSEQAAEKRREAEEARKAASKMSKIVPATR